MIKDEIHRVLFIYLCFLLFTDDCILANVTVQAHHVTPQLKKSERIRNTIYIINHFVGGELVGDLRHFVGWGTAEAVRVCVGLTVDLISLARLAYLRVLCVSS